MEEKIGVFGNWRLTPLELVNLIMQHIDNSV